MSPPGAAAVTFEQDEPSDREIVEMPPEAAGFPLPEIFLTAEGPNDSTALRIDLVYVHKKAGDKSWPFIDCRPVTQLRTLPDLLAAFGPGTFQLIGRNMENKQPNVKIVYQTIAAFGADAEADQAQRAAIIPHYAAPPPAPKLDVGAIVATASAIIAPLVEIWEKAQVRSAEERRLERELADRRFADERARERAQNETMMSVVTTALNSRNEDLRHAPPASAPGTDTTAAYQQGQADAIAMLQAAKDGGLASDGAGESQLMDLVGGFLQGAGAAKNKPPAPAAPAPAGELGE